MTTAKKTWRVWLIGEDAPREVQADSILLAVAAAADAAGKFEIKKTLTARRVELLREDGTVERGWGKL